MVECIDDKESILHEGEIIGFEENYAIIFLTKCYSPQKFLHKEIKWEKQNLRIFNVSTNWKEGDSVLCVDEKEEPILIASISNISANSLDGFNYGTNFAVVKVVEIIKSEFNFNEYLGFKGNVNTETLIPWHCKYIRKKLLSAGGRKRKATETSTDRIPKFSKFLSKCCKCGKDLRRNYTQCDECSRYFHDNDLCCCSIVYGSLKKNNLF